MFCRQCGAKLSDDSKFCNSCGNKVIDLNEAQEFQPDVQPQEAPKPQPNVTAAAPEIRQETEPDEVSAAVAKAANAQPEKRKKILIALLIIVVIAAIIVVVSYIIDKNKKTSDRWPFNVRYGTIDEDGTLTVTKDYQAMSNWDVPDSNFGESLTVTKLVIGKDVTKYKFNAGALPDLEEITVEEGNNTFIAIDNVLYKKDGGDALTLQKCPAKKTSVNIDSRTTVIAESAFYQCAELDELIIPEGVRTVEREAFCGCEKLRTINIPVSVSELDPSAFVFCSSLESFSVAPGSTFFSVQDRMLYGLDDKGGMNKLVRCPDTKTNVDVPYGTTEIGGGSFSNSSVESVTVPETVTVIGDSAFYGCEKLKNVTIANGLKGIGVGAFWNTPSLESIDLPDTVNTICDRAFNSSGLKSFTVPSNVTEIAYNAFTGCDGIVITIHNRVTSISEEAFGRLNGEEKPNVTIRCQSGSFAETYAKSCGFDCEII